MNGHNPQYTGCLEWSDQKSNIIGQLWDARQKYLETAEKENDASIILRKLVHWTPQKAFNISLLKETIKVGEFDGNVQCVETKERARMGSPKIKFHN